MAMLLRIIISLLTVMSDVKCIFVSNIQIFHGYVVTGQEGTILMVSLGTVSYYHIIHTPGNVRMNQKCLKEPQSESNLKLSYAI